MFQTLVTLTTAFAMFQHAVLGCCMHHSHHHDQRSWNAAAPHATTSHIVTACACCEHHTRPGNQPDKPNQAQRDRSSNNDHSTCDHSDCRFMSVGRSVKITDSRAGAMGWPEHLSQTAWGFCLTDVRPPAVVGRALATRSLSSCRSAVLRAHLQVWRL